MKRVTNITVRVQNFTGRVAFLLLPEKKIIIQEKLINRRKKKI